MPKKEISLSVHEAELSFDLLLRTEKIFNHIRRNSGVHMSHETAIKWQKNYEKLIITHAEFLEEVALDIGKPELYNDSKFISLLKDKQFNQN